MDTALTVRNEISLDLWHVIKEIAPVAKDSRLFGMATAEQAMMVMLKGKELGLSLTSSFEFVTVIDNKPALTPRGALALILNSPVLDGLEIKDEVAQDGKPSACTVTMKRKGGFTYTARFTMEDAQRAGLVKGGSGWEKYPANMLRARAIGFCADIVFPDVIGGMKRADELGSDLTPDGDAIEGSWNQVGSQQAQITAGDAPKTVMTSGAVTVSQSAPAITLNDLVSKYGTAAILEANGGLIPGTSEECAVVADKLANRKHTGTDLSLDVDMGGVMSNG